MHCKSFTQPLDLEMCLLFLLSFRITITAKKKKNVPTSLWTEGVKKTKTLKVTSAYLVNLKGCTGKTLQYHKLLHHISETCGATGKLKISVISFFSWSVFASDFASFK